MCSDNYFDKSFTSTDFFFFFFFFFYKTSLDENIFKNRKKTFIFNAVQRIDFITHYERTLRMLTHVVNACLTASFH